MSKLNLNAYGVTEMSYAEKVANNGGEIHLTNFGIDFIRIAFQGIVEDNKNNPYGQK